jgi:hypothetical protein
MCYQVYKVDKGTDDNNDEMLIVDFWRFRRYFLIYMNSHECNSYYEFESLDKT